MKKNNVNNKTIRTDLKSRQPKPGEILQEIEAMLGANEIGYTKTKNSRFDLK